MIDINRVYERVLFIANKEQRGYITPDEFNSFADQAQKEIFESYFIKKFQVNQAPGTTDDYSDISANVEEKISYFDNVSTIPRVGDIYPYNQTTHTFYRLGVVSVNGVMADEVSHKEATYINLSPLTKPVITQPVFTRHEGGITLYPTEYTGDVTFVYVRQPNTPNWTYVDGTDGTPFYNEEDPLLVPFELHPSDEQELVYKILTLSGVAIKAADVAQFGQAKDGQLAAQEG